MIEKWLLRMEDGKLSIVKKILSKHVPINRMLDVAGFYTLDSFKVGETKYMIVYDPSEHKTLKSRILVSRIGNNTLVSMDESDLENIEVIAKKFLGELKPILN